MENETVYPSDGKKLKIEISESHGKKIKSMSKNASKRA